MTDYISKALIPGLQSAVSAPWVPSKTTCIDAFQPSVAARERSGSSNETKEYESREKANQGENVTDPSLP